MTSTAQAPNYLLKVREQYEALPYPPYDPTQDRHMLHSTAIDNLDYLNHRFWDGKKTFNQDFRALCAGDGTGHASVILGEQLYEHGGKVVSLDLSTASQAIAKERAHLRKLTNITHIHSSLLDIPKLDIGTFDYISCSGVLHHLADPDAGLRTLADALKPGGVLAVMVYAPIGRSAVYQMQELMRLLLDQNEPMDEQLALTRIVLANLPRTNWFWFNRSAFMNDVTKYGDSGIFDLLLHTQDRAYSVPEIYEWIERCGLQMGQFSPTPLHPEYVYNPMRLTTKPEIKQVMQALPLQEQQALTELLDGSMYMHIFYAHKGDVANELSGDDHTLIPGFTFTSSLRGDTLTEVANILRAHIGKPSISFTLPGSNLPITITPSAASADLLSLIDNQRSIAEILQQTEQKLSLSKPNIIADWQTLYREMREQLLVVLRRSEGAPITPAYDLQQRSHARMDR